MVGFIKGFFGPKKVEAAVEPSEAPVKLEKKSLAFFLDADSAKTLGDIDYMRTAKAVRRTFPKTVSNPTGAESIKQISAMEMQALAEQGRSLIIEPLAAQPQPAAQPNPETQERRRTDTSMDLFRNMARDMKKR